MLKRSIYATEGLRVKALGIERICLCQNFPNVENNADGLCRARGVGVRDTRPTVLAATFSCKQLLQELHGSSIMRLVHRKPCHDLLRRLLTKLGAVAKVTKLPLERVPQLRFLVYAELMLLVKTYGARPEALEDDLELIPGAGIGARFGCGRKAPPEVGRKNRGELLDVLRAETLQDGHGKPIDS